MRTLKYPKPAPRPKGIGRRVLASLTVTHRQLVQKADILWRRLIYAKEPTGVCPVCRKRPWTDAMHGFAKGRYPSLRFEEDNGIPGCRTCHRIIDCDHHAKLELWRRYIGPERYEALRLRAQGQGKLDMRLVLMDLEARVAALPPQPARRA